MEQKQKNLQNIIKLITVPPTVFSLPKKPCQMSMVLYPIAFAVVIHYSVYF